MSRLSENTALVDILHQGRPAVIGTGVFESSEGVGLVDPGPTSCIETLRAGLAELGHSMSDVAAIFLTHIHLDHATATGAIIREAPDAVVYVHPRGATHMVDPARLLSSATRIYGAAMDTLWGEFVPVPASAVREVDEGDQVRLGERSFDVAYVPGHAKHHVAYHEAATGTAWVGDVGGIRLPGGIVTPVTPPPDIDVGVWHTSMARVLVWTPRRIVPTHFGVVEDPESHFQALGRGLDAWAEWVKESLEDPPTDSHGPGTGPNPGDPEEDSERAERFAAWIRSTLGSELSPELTEAYEFASGFRDSWWGLARYWRKRA